MKVFLLLVLLLRRSETTILDEDLERAAVRKVEPWLGVRADMVEISDWDLVKDLEKAAHVLSASVSYACAILKYNAVDCSSIVHTEMGYLRAESIAKEMIPLFEQRILIMQIGDYGAVFDVERPRLYEVCPERGLGADACAMIARLLPIVKGKPISARQESENAFLGTLPPECTHHDDGTLLPEARSSELEPRGWLFSSISHDTVLDFIDSLFLYNTQDKPIEFCFLAMRKNDNSGLAEALSMRKEWRVHFKDLSSPLQYNSTLALDLSFLDDQTTVDIDAKHSIIQVLELDYTLLEKPLVIDILEGQAADCILLKYHQKWTLETSLSLAAVVHSLDHWRYDAFLLGKRPDPAIIDPKLSPLIYLNEWSPHFEFWAEATIFVVKASLSTPFRLHAVEWTAALAPTGGKPPSCTFDVNIGSHSVPLSISTRASQQRRYETVLRFVKKHSLQGAGCDDFDCIANLLLSSLSCEPLLRRMPLSLNATTSLNDDDQNYDSHDTTEE